MSDRLREVTKKVDTISRQAVKDALVERTILEWEQLKTCYPMLEVVDEVPTSQPEQRWIPCSERLPEDDALMLVNYRDDRPNAGDIWIGWHEMDNVWYIDGEAHSREFGNEVIAWMPLPEPYRKEGEADGQR